MTGMTSRVVHFEIPIDDPDRAGGFYRAVFDWAPRRWGEVPYWSVADDPASVPGVAGALTLRAEAPEGVLVYVEVDDIEAAIARTEAAGGSVVSPQARVPGVGLMARIRDTEGNMVGILQPEA